VGSGGRWGRSNGIGGCEVRELSGRRLRIICLVFICFCF
jgi:hypothetical protein